MQDCSYLDVINFHRSKNNSCTQQQVRNLIFCCKKDYVLYILRQFAGELFKNFTDTYAEWYCGRLYAKLWHRQIECLRIKQRGQYDRNSITWKIYKATVNIRTFNTDNSNYLSIMLSFIAFLCVAKYTEKYNKTSCINTKAGWQSNNIQVIITLQCHSFTTLIIFSLQVIQQISNIFHIFYASNDVIYCLSANLTMVAFCTWDMWLFAIGNLQRSPLELMIN